SGQLVKNYKLTNSYGKIFQFPKPTSSITKRKPKPKQDQYNLKIKVTGKKKKKEDKRFDQKSQLEQELARFTQCEICYRSQAHSLFASTSSLIQNHIIRRSVPYISNSNPL
ncbi:hypothetical protein PanWU01x14_098430, partial [Parasponia andersonii]